MAKYDFEFKKKVVEAYLCREGGYQTLSKKYGLKSTRQIGYWVKFYNHFRDEGLKLLENGRVYPFELKILVVESYLKGNVSYSELVLKYGILNHRVIGSWIKKYKLDGPKTCDAPTVREEELQETVVKAMNEVIKTSEETSTFLIKNIEEEIAGSNLKEIEVINKETTAKQKELLAQVRAKKDYTEIAD